MTPHEAMAYMFLAAALVVFYHPIARPLAKFARWAWEQRPGRKEREAERRRIWEFRRREEI
jgi:hypothetical protein